jgi:hypothetical protein
MVKALLVFGLAPFLFATDPREIVRQAVERNERNSQAADNYTFLQRLQIRELDRSGEVRSQRIQTWDVTFLEGSPYKRLVARDDRPLSAAEQRIEEERLRRCADERKRETPEQRQRRLAEWRHHEERQRQPLRELPDAFDFTLAGEEEYNGRPAYRIEAVPKAGYKPKSEFAAFFPKVKVHAWIDKDDLQGARIEIDAIDTISFGGFLLRLEKGSRIVIEQTRMDDALWLPQRVSVAAAARLLLVKSLDREMDYSFSDYKKFQSDSHIVYLQPAVR